nr:hypothetical protein [Caballeronia sp. LZ024]
MGEEKATDAKLTAGCESSTNCQSPPSIHGPRASLPFDISRRLRSVNEKNDESVTADARNMRAFGKHVRKTLADGTQDFIARRVAR